MHVRFYYVAEKPRERDVAEAVGAGVMASGDSFSLCHASQFVEPEYNVDVACVYALKGAAKSILDGYRTMGARTLLFDKGLIRASTGQGGPSGYNRVSLDEFMPLSRIERMIKEGVSSKRWVATGMKPMERPKAGPEWPVIYAGSSQKYCDFHGLGDEHEYAVELIRKIRKQAGKARRVIYRPKPSYREAQPIEGTDFSRPPELLGTLLRRGAYALVTHGSHAAIDAILSGTPAIVLGDGAARPVSGTELEGLNDRPWYPGQELRFKWLSAIGWWQWTIREMVDGAMWRFLREEMEKPA